MLNNIVAKGWGYELWVENNDLYCLKHLHVIPTKKCSIHYHKNKKETFYIIKGSLILEWSRSMELDDWNQLGKWIDPPVEIMTTRLNVGDSFTIEPLVAHRFYTATSEPCDFIEGSTHHDDSDSYRILKGD